MSERLEIARRLATLGDVAEIMGALKNAAMVEAILTCPLSAGRAHGSLPAPSAKPLPLTMTVLYHEVGGHSSEVQVKQPFRAFAGEGHEFPDPPRLYLDPLAFFRELTDHLESNCSFAGTIRIRKRY